MKEGTTYFKDHPLPPDETKECPGSGASGCDYLYPSRALASSMHVVAAVTFDDGIGGQYTQSYVYAGARYDVARHRSLGFSVVARTDSRDGRVTERYFDQVFPLAGRETRRVVVLADGTMVREDLQDWTTRTYGSGTRYFPFASSVQAIEFEVDGSLIPE